MCEFAGEQSTGEGECESTEGGGSDGTETAGPGGEVAGRKYYEVE